MQYSHENNGSLDYPPMSHPSADPAVNVRVARAAGLFVRDPSVARILEIGCGEGHHILSLGSRWPEAKCTGLDISGRAISRARRRARQAGIGNVNFCEIQLSEFEPDATYDFIIAHGFFSWVADEVKLGMMDFMQKHLAPDGIAVVSFNVAAGWKARVAVVEKALAILTAGATDTKTALVILRSVTDAEQELAIIDDMLAKDPAVLAWDDFAPVMDPWSLGAFLKLTESRGLQWLGDSVSGERGNDRSDYAERKTFRSEILCRKDAIFGDPTPSIAPVFREPGVPNFPKLNPWRLLCVREALPVVDADLKPCTFSFAQLRVMLAMDGSRSIVRLAEHAREVAPELNFISWLRHIAERGLLD